MRAKDGEESIVEGKLEKTIFPSIKANCQTLDPKLAKCVNCKGEFTWLSSWKEKGDVEIFEKSASHSEAVSGLLVHLRAPAKRELWEMLSTEKSFSLSPGE